MITSPSVQGPPSSSKRKDTNHATEAAQNACGETKGRVTMMMMMIMVAVVEVVVVVVIVISNNRTRDSQLV
jgi:NADH:ubiquinone oxidoreductase subunit K